MAKTTEKYDSTEILRTKKNTSSDLVVSKVTRDGGVYADIRLFMGNLATKKGLFVPQAQIEALLELLDAKEGILPQEGGLSLRVRVQEFKGHTGLDIRLYASSPRGDMPTQRGVRVPLDKVYDIKQALKKLLV